MSSAPLPFLILQARPESDAADDEYQAILDKGKLDAAQTQRIRLDREALPAGLDLADFAGVILGGGPPCISDPRETQSDTDRRIEDAVLGLMPSICEQDIPFLGCCYGISVLGHHLGGEVSKARYAEPVGPSHCLRVAGMDDPLLEGVPDAFTAFVGHKEALQALPEGCVHLVQSATCPLQMIRYRNNIYATQFHPELDTDGLETRIKIYQHHGYFPAEDADKLIAAAHAADVFAPERVLANFVARYREPQGHAPRGIPTQ